MQLLLCIYMQTGGNKIEQEFKIKKKKVINQIYFIFSHYFYNGIHQLIIKTDY